MLTASIAKDESSQIDKIILKTPKCDCYFSTLFLLCTKILMGMWIQGDFEMKLFKVSFALEKGQRSITHY